MRDAFLDYVHDQKDYEEAVVIVQENNPAISREAMLREALLD